ncbi:hypothetical protein AQPE_3911 [Aquipluma nitroreducens]|uniref:Uncharacterized protein n=1 Tax=Aquipluma nitroreducens TaxID=2010828 RepID=A0A5K7SDS7_9BACT|nr:hypothetical protein [Aquipluma nitroreducens]BBE19723.1 hypothetical protein AQPE_3911 [Aquipluma nitroreducens]
MSAKKKVVNQLDGMILKTNLKQEVYQKAVGSFALLKEVLKELADDYRNKLKDKVDDSVLPVYQEKGPFEAEFRLGGDMLIFSMHSNVFVFNREHPIWKLDYIKANPLNSYCGVFNIYNFLTDSFKYNRMEDLGYLIARIFINRENHFFVEGKRQSTELVKDFESDEMSKKYMKEIIETAVQYAIDFDLLVPPYDQVKIVTVDQMNAEINNSKIQTGKRLGFKFNSDDV